MVGEVVVVVVAVVVVVVVVAVAVVCLTNVPSPCGYRRVPRPYLVEGWSRADATGLHYSATQSCSPLLCTTLHFIALLCTSMQH